MLDGLSTELRRRVPKLLPKEGWTLSVHDTGTVDPVFEELADSVLTESKAAQKATVYISERTTRESSTVQATFADMPPTSETSTTTTTTMNITLPLVIQQSTFPPQLCRPLSPHLHRHPLQILSRNLPSSSLTWHSYFKATCVLPHKPSIPMSLTTLFS